MSETNPRFVVFTRYQQISGFVHKDKEGIPTSYLVLARRFVTASEAKRFMETNRPWDFGYTVLEIVEEVT